MRNYEVILSLAHDNSSPLSPTNCMDKKRLGDYVRESKFSSVDKDAELRRQKLEELKNNLTDAASKRSFALERIQGTPLQQYFSAEEAALCLDFLKTMRRRFYKRAETIVPTPGLRKNLPSTGMFGLLGQGGQVAQRWKGYGIGYMSGANGVIPHRSQVQRGPYMHHLPTQNVFLCSDGRLRTREAMSLSEGAGIQIGFYQRGIIEEKTIPDTSSAGYYIVKEARYDWVNMGLGDVLDGHIAGRTFN